MNEFSSIIIVVGIFILVREFICWYFKLNKIAFLLEQINNKLSKTLKQEKSGIENYNNKSDDIESEDIEAYGIELIEDNEDPLSFCYHCGASLEKDVKQCPECKKTL